MGLPRTTQGGLHPQSHVGPSVINLGLGQPSPSLLPLDLIGRAAADRLGPAADPLILQYGTIAGPEDFRASVADLLTRRYRYPVAAHELMITGGTSSAIALVSQVFAAAGQAVVCSDPTYFLARGMLQTQGLRPVGIEVDADGLRVDVLERQLADEGLRPALVYCVPSFHNPTGVTLAPHRAERLVQLAVQYGFVIVADEPYVLLHFGPDPPPCMMSYDAGRGVVLSLGSFSKILGPGLRLGWVHAEPGLLARWSAHGALRSGGGLNPLVCAVVHGVLGSGGLDRNIEHLRAQLCQRKRALVAALRDVIPQVRFADPGGGYFVWVQLPAGVDTAALRARAPTCGVDFTPGARCAIGRDLSRWLRLSFAMYEPDELAEGVARLARLAQLT